MEKEVYLTQLSEIIEKQRNESQTQYAQLLVELNALKAELDRLKVENAALKATQSAQPKVVL